MNSEAKNLEAICNAIKEHDRTCDFDATAVVLNPFEKERLDWDEIMGVPILGDPKVSTGRIVVLCDKEGQPDSDTADEVEEELDVVSPYQLPVAA